MARFLKARTRAGDVVMDARRALYVPGSRALLLGDIHFEKASFLQEVGGHPLPAFDTLDNLNRLEALVADWKPAVVVALGDSFHDVRAGERLSEGDRARLNRVLADTDMIWVLGNHDPDIPEGVAGRREDHVELGGFLLTHHPHAPEAGGVNVCGHLHPKARVVVQGRKLSGPCFAVCEERIVVPSFGAYTGGLWVSDPAFARETGLSVAGGCRYYVTAQGVVAPLRGERVY